jgi:hypothetical protein
LKKLVDKCSSSRLQGEIRRGIEAWCTAAKVRIEEIAQKPEDGRMMVSSKVVVTADEGYQIGGVKEMLLDRHQLSGSLGH